MSRAQTDSSALVSFLVGCAALAACHSSARHSESVPAPASVADARHAQAPTFAGAWSTTYGTLRLTQDGARLGGTYSLGDGATIFGTVDGRLFHARYEEPHVSGRATFELAEDGQSFAGVWRAGPETEPLALDAIDVTSWSGTRIEPVEGRVWLIVLEAYWQGDLREPDYSYGEMLRAYFERLPNVAFRQRFFHDERDFVRCVRECEALLEPVVLYVSSHGSTEGIASPGGMIGGQAIGAALRNVVDLKLFHLGGCAMLGGDLPATIRSASGPRAAYPISGFKVPVDWGGSAIVDFTYLDLVLARGLEPEQAVAQTRRLLAFAGNSAPEGSAIGPADLAIDLGSP